MPDVFVLHEVPRQMRKTVMDQLRARVLGRWIYRHSDVGDCDRLGDCGNTMIAWRTDKLSFEDDHRWDLKWKRPGSPCRLSSSKAAVAVKLSEDGTNSEIVVAGIHLYKLDNQPCTQQNVRRAEKQLESQWPMRPVTVLSGDFNKMAHECGGPKHCGDVPITEWRGERNADDSDNHEELACWYKGLGARYETSLDADCSRFSFDESYYDAIWEREPSEQPTSGICAAWTFDNVERKPAQEGEVDSCRSRQKRIDFMWIRWEDAAGDATEFGAQEVPEEKLVSANTDQGWQGAIKNKYSDHRAMRALVSW